MRPLYASFLFAFDDLAAATRGLSLRMWFTLLIAT